MVLLRSTALRRPITQAARCSVRAAERQSWQRAAGRRTYASAKETAQGAAKKAGGDLPWLIGSVAVTIPSVFYLLQPKSGGHGDEHGGHGETESHEEKGEGEGEGEEEPKEESDSGEKSEGGEEGGEEKKDESDDASSESEGGEKKDEGKEDSESKGEEDKSGDADDSEGKDTESDKSTTTKEAGETSESGDVQFKGPGSGVKADTRKKEPSPKSDTGEKKRIDSALRIPQGVAGDESQISDQQKGVSMAPTMHSTDQMKNPEQSKKSEGAPDTAKIPHTINPNRIAT